MVRPQLERIIGREPVVRYYKPRGVPLRELEEVILTEDALEAIRLVDFEGLYQEEAANKMGVSRPTLSRILEIGRMSLADAIVNGKAIRIEGGQVKFNESSRGRGFGRGRRRRGGW